MANQSSSPTPSRGGEEPVIAKGPFLMFLFMMPAFIFVIALMLVTMQYKQLRAFVSPSPMPMPTVPVSAEAQDKVLARLHAFFADTAQDTLSMTTEDVNHLTRSSRSLADTHLDYHLSLEDSVVVARNSLPVSTLHGTLGAMAKVTRIKGFLNSEMKGYPELKDGKITMVPVGAVMNGIPAPVSVLDQKGPIDLREWVADKDFYDQSLARLSDVKVRGGALLLIKKRWRAPP